MDTNNGTPRKGFRVAPQPTKGEVLQDNAQLAQQLAQRLSGAEKQVNFLGQMLSQTVRAVQNMGPEVNSLSTITAAVDSKSAAKENDYVMIDYLGRLVNEDGSDQLDADGDPMYFNGGYGSKFVILGLGNGTLIPGFEEQLVGMNIGESKEISVKFPDNYGPELSNKHAKFQVYVHKIYVPLSRTAVEQTKMDYDLKKADIKAKKAAAEAEAKTAADAVAQATAEAANGGNVTPITGTPNEAPKAEASKGESSN